MRACKEQRRKGQRGGTWISEEMVAAYVRLHQDGIAHSVEVWKEQELVGGLYGICLGKMFFGESMFARENNASKVGFITLVRVLERQGFWIIDCQQETRHLKSLGARSISRKDFLKFIAENKKQKINAESWSGIVEDPLDTVL